jgi:hypothetical protein
MLIVGILILSIASFNSCMVVNGQEIRTLDVMQYGAKGDGSSDDTKVRVYTIFHFNFIFLLNYIYIYIYYKRFHTRIIRKQYDITPDFIENHGWIEVEVDLSILFF